MATTPKYPKPKILLVDLPSACERVLKAAGYNVNVGSFGTPYQVDASASLQYVSLESCTLPNVEEQEIVVASLSRPAAIRGSPCDFPGVGVDALWQQGVSGAIDPRPYFMSKVRTAFDRILANGGIFIVFAARKYRVEYCNGAFNGSHRYPPVAVSAKFTRTNWSFLAGLEQFEVENIHGEEITFDKDASEFSDLLVRGSADAEYSCAVAPHHNYANCWLPVATNKYGQCVGGLLAYGDPRRFMLLLPQMPAVDRILVELVEDWCSQRNPLFFPHLNGAKWVHRKEYEIPEILALAHEIGITQEKAKVRVAEIEEQIERVRVLRGEWYTLLSGTGSDLVTAVIKTLGILGFGRVVDADEESRRQGQSTNLREDIQIHDRRPTLIVDVKGVYGHPDDDEARQAEKHATMRMREWNRTDVQPLTIINHQRHLPPLDRDRLAYRQEIIDNAVVTGLGLMTSWDLFRLLRNKEALGWSPEDILPIFYRKGRIEPIPEHYRAIGKVERVWERAFGVIPGDAVRVGMRLAIEMEVAFTEIVVDSLQIEARSVAEVQAGVACGIGMPGADQTLRKGMRVFIIESRP